MLEEVQSLVKVTPGFSCRVVDLHSDAVFLWYSSLPHPLADSAAAWAL